MVKSVSTGSYRILIKPNQFNNIILFFVFSFLQFQLDGSVCCREREKAFIECAGSCWMRQKVTYSMRRFRDLAIIKCGADSFIHTLEVFNVRHGWLKMDQHVPGNSREQGGEP